MELEEILERLKKTIDLSKTLKEEQFNYNKFVTEFDYDNECGTVCCIAGHYPNWGIDIFKYNISTIFIIEVNQLSGENPLNDGNSPLRLMKNKLIEYHGLSEYLINVLFYGENFEGTFTDEFRYVDGIGEYSLKEVIERFETVYELLENKTITPDWES